MVVLYANAWLSTSWEFAVCLQSVLYWLPWLTLVADDERISPETFSRCNERWHSARIPLRGTSDQLKNCTAGPWKLKHAGRLIVLCHHLLFQGSHSPRKLGIVCFLLTLERLFFPEKIFVCDLTDYSAFVTVCLVAPEKYTYLLTWLLTNFTVNDGVFVFSGFYLHCIIVDIQLA